MMMAAELYQKTLTGYEASLGKRESISMSRYCKLHHVNNRGLRYWMKKNSIISFKGKSGRLAGASGTNNTTQSVPGSHQMVPLLIQSPMGGKAKKLTHSFSSNDAMVINMLRKALIICLFH